MVKELSFFLPFYNEEPIVTDSIQNTFKVLRGLSLRCFEVIAVENGSTDRTLEGLKKLKSDYPELRVIHLEQAGYGRAIRKGFEEARYEWIFFADSDLQIDLDNLPRFIAEADAQKTPMVIGYRTNRADGWHRKLNAQIICLANRVLFGVKAKDIDCAFKLLHRSVVDKIMPLQSDGAIISTEILAKAVQHRVSILQLPVTHLPDPHGGSTGASPKVLLKAAQELLHLYKTLNM